MNYSSKSGYFYRSMSLYISSLNSGSNGNCYYVGNENEAILVDAGLTCSETEKRLLRLGLPVSKIKAVFISHEHTDHIKGVTVLAKKYQLPVYITPGTLISSKLKIDDHLIRPLKAYQEICVGRLCITAFPKIHDASDPHSFMISCDDIRVGVFTDIGDVCEALTLHFSQCHAAFLESNFDDTLLENGRYPYFLKNRIRGGKGHLSNIKALDLFRLKKPVYMSHLFLSHLSKDNNCPDLVNRLFNGYATGTEIIVASRDHETAVYHIGNKKQINSQIASSYYQTSLF